MSIENPVIYVPIRHSIPVENFLQISSFMQNKPKQTQFQMGAPNVTNFLPARLFIKNLL